MTDKLVENIRRENYLIEIFDLTRNASYLSNAKKIIEFVKEIYRHIEPSHFEGQIVVFFDLSDTLNFKEENKEELYDKSILSGSFSNLIFQLQARDKSFPLYWTNVNDLEINDLLNTSNNFIAYVFEEKTEFFIVNNTTINITNNFSCPSIFALQYHYLQEALQDYKIERIKNVSCEHFKQCWEDKKWIYLKNQPENCMQISLSEFLKSRIRGINVYREFNLGASKPVDVRVFWREANRAALIELKWLGQSLANDGELGTNYRNGRVNKGMEQIKEYIDLDGGDSPTTITKGYLVVIDARRRKIDTKKVNSISREDGFYYKNKDLKVKANRRYWESYPNIEEPIRMFVEPICEM